MLTMTSLPPDSYPLGARDSAHLRFPGISSDASSSVISPLTLPRGTTGYFDHPSGTSHPASGAAARKARAGNVYSPSSPAGVPQFLSPHLTPLTREVQRQLHPQRSASLSPTRHIPSLGATRVRSMVSSPSGVPAGAPFVAGGFASHTAVPPLSSMSSGHPRSASADAAGAPSQNQMVRRLVQQNGRIREAWEAERKYMEANRERAEEVYKEERALMEEERAEWEEEKAILVEQIERLEQQVWTLGGDVRLAGESRVDRADRPSVSVPTRRSGDGIAELEQRNRSPSDSATQSHGAGPAQRTGALVSGGDAFRGPRAPVAFQPIAGAAALLPMQAAPLGSIQERLTPPKQHESASFIPPASHIPLPPSSTESMASPVQEDADPIPIVDIQEIHPELEGIPIKAPAVQKPTFRDSPSPPSSKPSSNASSPPTSAAATAKLRRAAKGDTLQLLAANAVERLTMHAGHTPNHSLSLLPTATISQVTTASSSGDSTPTLQLEDSASAPTSSEAAQGKEPVPVSQPYELDVTVHATTDHPEPILEPADDIELKGPLMVRNMPAHDELFFRRLSDKLEEVSKGSQAAVPAVLKDTFGLNEPNGDEKDGSEAVAGTNVDGAAAAAAADDSSNGSSKGSPTEKGSDSDELEIPLKLKKSNNFGAPFGEFR
ncbi:hypothetical protein GQ53DRAFT_458450 [Thozetella sp. PMI_491]|nr:hypothetical protein GQ53DRAFT_458450 [Thozetella sp. PMI_491]